MRRSMLFLPGNTPNIIVNGEILGADAVILDLEDAVAPAEKDSARILVRNAIKYMGFGKSTVASFADKNEIDSWAVSAIKWAFATEADMDTTAPGNIPYAKTQYVNGKGSLNGKPLMAPKANATRAEVATMLYRYMTGVRVPKE